MLLVVYLGDRRVLTHRLQGPRVTIGRADGCDVALPSSMLSRVHGVFSLDDDGWRFDNQGKSGTLLGHEPVTQRRVREGDLLRMGEYALELRELHEPSAASLTREAPAGWEEVIDARGGEVATRRASARVVRGPYEGEEIVLRKRRSYLGGLGADVVIDPALPAQSAVLVVVRGRVMVEGRDRPVFLEGQRVTEQTPVYAGEVLRIGDAEVEIVAEVGPVARGEVSEGFGGLVGSSAVMRRAHDLLARVARFDAPVLLVGESGTGKELAARTVHEAGRRAERPFVALNCAAIPTHLVESQLFGHEKGAFTGAEKRTDGAFQRADKGTIFLDELGEMPYDTQARLLRVLESGEVLRVGGAAPEFPDVRVVAATNRDLPRMVKEGTFREDLYFRLSVLTIRLPPLREHADDVVEIAEALLRQHHPGARLHPSAHAALRAYPWPGNVRELRNLLTRSVVMGGDRIDAASLSEHLPGAPSVVSEASVAWATDEAAEKASIEAALRRCGGNRSQAARELGVARTTLNYKMMRYGLM